MQIAYRDEGSGPPLVLLHGLMANGDFFREQSELERDFRLIIPDLRGHGRSVAGSRLPNIDLMANDVEELVESLNLEGAIGIGWSLGATLLWKVLAGRQSTRFCGAVIVDMTARVRNGDQWSLGLSQEACDARSHAIRGDYSAFATLAGPAIFAQPLADWKQDLAVWAGEQFARNDSGAIAATWESLIAQDVRPLLGRIDQPSLIVHGAHSGLYGEDTAGHLVSALPNAKAVMFETSGHAPHLEQPEKFNRLVTDFAARLPCGRPIQTTES